MTADVERDGASLVINRVLAQVGTDVVEAQGTPEALGLLRKLPGERWFGPSILDVVGAAHEAGVAVPRAAVDPALMLFLLHPDQPPSVAEFALDADALSPRGRAWLATMERDVPAPEHLEEVAQLLPAIDVRLGTELQRERLAGVLECDVAPTLPVLAKIERQGAWVRTPAGMDGTAVETSDAWKCVLVEREREIERQIEMVRPILGDLDPLRATTAELVDKIQRKIACLVGSERPLELTAKEKLDRLAARGVTEAEALKQLRSLSRSGAGTYWLRLLAAGERRLMGTFSPATTGRWNYAKHPLQNVPKRGVDGRRIRSGLYGPPGYMIVAADWDSFETRLLASITGDPVLLDAAWDPARNMHSRLAAALSTTRDRSKAGMLAITYGQGRDGFWKAHPEIRPAHALELYRRVRRTAGVATMFQYQFSRRFYAGMPVRSPSGWRRKPTKWREGFNVLIQGMAADIMRWTLRTLDVELRALGAFLIHQAHDEVFVAALPDRADAVAAALIDVMDRGVREASGLLGLDVPLPVKIRRGMSWLDVT